MSFLRSLLDRLIGRSASDRSSPEEHGPKDDALASEDSVRPRPPRPIVIGVDFGTSGTKIALRDFADRRRTPTIVDFGTGLPGYSRFSLPSTVKFVGDRVLVGREAESWRGAADRIFRSPKRDLLEKRAPPESELASAIIVGAALRRAMKALDEDVRTSPGAKLLFNIDVPVASVGEDVVPKRFLRVLEAGRVFAEQLPPEPSLAHAIEVWQSCEIGGEPVGDVIPEAQAVMQGISTVSDLEREQIHAVLDIGAGTVDMGIFKVMRLQLGERIPFWAADTLPEGCDDLDRNLCKQLFKGPCDSDVMAEIRAAKIRACKGESVRIGKKLLEMTLVARASTSLAKTVRQAYSAVFGEAYRKQPNTDEWKVLRTLVVGGGSLIPPLEAALLLSPRDFVEVCHIPTAGSGSYRVIGESTKVPGPEELPFLIPAVGLSHIKPEMPDFLGPDEVQPLPVPRGPTGIWDFDADDLFLD